MARRRRVAEIGADRFSSVEKIKIRFRRGANQGKNHAALKEGARMSEVKQIGDADIEILPVAVDSETMERLLRVARLVGRHPLDCAQELFYLLMRDDYYAHLDTLNPSSKQ
jgi:hypothetical protein